MRRIGFSVVVLTFLGWPLSVLPAMSAEERSTSGDSVITPACSEQSVLAARVEYGYTGPQFVGLVNTPKLQSTVPQSDPTPSAIPKSVATCSISLVESGTWLPDPEPVVTLTLGKAGLVATFSFKDSEVRTEQTIFRNTHFQLFVHRSASTDYLSSVRTPAGTVLTATVDANKTCETINKSLPYQLQHQQCSADVTRTADGWKGSMTVRYADLDTALGGDSSFAVTVRHTAWPKSGRVVFCGAPLSREPLSITCMPPIQRSFIEIDRERANPWQERYASLGGDFGKIVDVPPHRIVTNTWFPIDQHDLFASSFADDSGKLLQIRDSTASGILDKHQAAAFKCHSCGTFQVDDTQPFDLALTSSNVLGVDLSSLQVDTVPFSFKATTFPIDAGYKFFHSGDSVFGTTMLDGTTTSNGVARDSAFQYKNMFYWPSSRLGVDLYDVTANRSQLATPSPGFFPSVRPLIQHSVNSQASLAYATTTLKQAADAFAPDTTVRTFSTLFRYGTQYVPNSQTLDLALSTLRDPAVIDLHTIYGDRLHYNWALGYRNVGPAYAPIDGVFDTHAGMHGFYGTVELTNPICKENENSPACALRSQVADFKVTAFRFGDAVKARDVSVRFDLTYPFFDTFGLQASLANASMSISQAARSNNIVVTDTQGGRLFLPNGQYTIKLNYSANTGRTKYFEMSAGYSQAQLQNCTPTNFAAPPPCFAYRSPGFTGSLYWVPFRSHSDLFIAGSNQNSTNEPFTTGQNALLKPSAKDLFQTTATHIVSFAGIGMHIINKCSTILITTANRGGDSDNYANNPPQPGFTNTASMEIVPTPWWPTLLIAYSRVVNRDPTPTSPNQTSFLVRLQYGITPPTYSAALARKCAAAA